MSLLWVGWSADIGEDSMLAAAAAMPPRLWQSV